MIHIGLCTDNRYAMPCGVCVTSLFENNKDEEITVYVLEKGLTDDNKEKFRTLAADYGQKIEVIPVDDSLFKGYPTTYQFRLSTYYRFLFANILPKDVQKLIYLDCDTLVLDSLRELWNTDVTDYSIAAVEDQQGDNVHVFNRLQEIEKYYNSGVLILNLARWRKDDSMRHLMQLMDTDAKRFVFLDQDAINVLFRDSVLELPYQYNVQNMFYMKDKEKALHWRKWERIAQAKEHPVVLHFCSSVKPWQRECQHPRRQLFLDYLHRSPWKGQPLGSCLDGRSLKYKIFYYLVHKHILPGYIEEYA